MSRLDGVKALLRHAGDIDRLNAASRRPSAFASAAFLNSYALRSEYHLPGQGERLFLVSEGGRAVGCAPLRQRRERLSPDSFSALRLTGSRLEFLVAADTEQLQFSCAPEDEERVFSALLRHFCEHEPHWGMLELVGLRPGSALHRAMHEAGHGRYRTRDVPVEPFTEVPLGWENLKAYFRSLTKHMRSNVSRQVRRLYQEGKVELVLATGGTAVGAWFDAYCDLDGRSWKGGTAASISRNSRRVRLYREIASGQAGFEPSFVGVLLDDALIAGLLVGSNGAASPERHGAWCLEMAYDRTYAALGPGQLLLLLAVSEALARHDGFLNFLQNFGYYKQRWGAAPIEVVNVQLFRRLSPHDVRARVGDARRWWQARRAEPSDQAVAPPEHAESSSALTVPVDRERSRWVTAAARAAAGDGMRVIDRNQARGLLPFDFAASP